MTSKETTMDKDKRSLYDEALERFRKDAAERHSSPKDLELLAEFLRERASPEETKQAAEVLQGDAGKKWGGRKVGDVEIPESWIANIMANIEIFVAAGDFVTKNAPESVGMAWYAVKLTLTAIHSNYDLYTFFGSGLSDISEIMIIVRHYDRLYDERTKPHWKPSPLVEKLFQDVISAYAAVLDFSFAVKRHLTAGALTRIKHGFKDFFGISKAKFEDKLSTVATFKKKIIEESQGAFQDKTLTQLHGVSTVLAGIEGTVQHIRDFQETQKKLHEDAMAKFDTLIKGLDDIKASTKRKTQWDYAVQDFQSYQEALSPLEGHFKILGDTIDAVYPGTCQWVFEDRLYQQWADAAGNALLCVTGPEGSGKSYVVASVANRITQAADPGKVLLYVTCGGSTTGAGLGNSQSYTADSICRTILSQLYDLAVQGEDNVGLLEACNAVFKKAKAKAASLPGYVRTDSSGLPEFADAFSHIAGLLKKDVVLVLDGLDKTNMDDKNQDELLRKVRAVMAAVADRTSVSLHLLAGCSSSAAFLHGLDLAPDAYIDVQRNNRADIELVLTDALTDVPGLSAAERETAKAAILEKARSRFLYVRDTAIPFMREPFQRPLSKRLEALPDGASDVYAKALRTMSPNYLDLLRTALTWTLMSPPWPGLPHAREIMDAFQGTYDFPPETEGGDDEYAEAGFPPISRLELEQLRGATDAFLTLFPSANGTVWVWEADALALAEYFVKFDAGASEESDEADEPGEGEEAKVDGGTDVHEEANHNEEADSGEKTDCHDESDNHGQLCARCGSALSAAETLRIEPKQAHLQMALTCLRHLNNPLFQKRAGLITARESLPEDSVAESSKQDVNEDEEGPSEDQAQPEAEAAEDQAVDDYLKLMQDGYTTEDSIDDEDVIVPRLHDREYDSEGDNYANDDDDDVRVRYELQYWRYHLIKAELLWPAKEREENSDWAALMSELDKFVFETPEVFAAWQAKYPDEKNEEDLFSVANGPHKPLHVAAYLGSYTWVKHLLDRGEVLNGLSGGYSPLQAAACSGMLRTMRVFLEKGADINAQNNADRSAFHLYLMRGELGVDEVEFLLEHGADSRATCSSMHHSPLQYFANRGEDPAVLELLLAHGADINAVHPDDGWRLPPLHILLIRREVPLPLLEAFVKHNADTNTENAASARPLQIVCTNGLLDCLLVLLKSEVLEIDDPDLHGTTAVHEAAYFGHPKCVKALLEHGADPDIADKVNRVALHSAARRGLVEVVRVLLEYTKQVNLRDHGGWSPLFCACLGKEEDAALLILEALIEHDIPLSEINKPTRSGRTVLRQAADHGFDKVVSRLIQLAADRNDTASLDINARDSKKSMTALHRASLNGHAACVQALIAGGADPSLLDTQSRSALALAYEQWSVITKKSSYEDIISILITANPAAAISDPDLVAVCAANGSVRLLTQLWRLNAPLNRPDRFGWTPLELARHFARKEAEAFLKQQATWASLLPSKWSAKFPSTTPVGAPSVCEGGKKILHTSGKRVCVSADRPLPAGLEGYYFELTLLDLPDGLQNDIEYPEMAIGFCTLGGAALEFPGWFAASDANSTAKSWGYHSDTGGLYSSSEQLEVDNPVDEARYRVGDTVGCGVDLGRGEIWFTKNGTRLERVCKGVEGRLVPVVGLCEGVCFVTNFGGEGEGVFRYKFGDGVEGGKEEVKVKGEKEGGVVEVVVLGAKGGVGEKGGTVVKVTSEEVAVESK